MNASWRFLSKQIPLAAHASPITRHLTLALLLALGGSGIALAEVYPTGFTWMGGVSNTRHNLTQSTNSNKATTDVMMATSRNDYGEVCVYCHTPHGANSENIAAPLWNRSFKSNTYTTYNQLGTQTLTQTVSQPGINSLTCLSCHDGTVAIDAIVNMPGSGMYNTAAKTSHQEAFLDSWNTSQGKPAYTHGKMGTACLVCHDGEVAGHDMSGSFISTDLTNDHPIGVVLPEARIGVDFQDPTVRKSDVAFYDGDSDNRPDANEIRFYKVDADYKVECASCHDPHGVRTGGDGSALIGRFLRVNNDNSGVCLTCHNM